MTKPMTKTQLVAAIAEEMGTDKKTATARWRPSPRLSPAKWRAAGR